MKKLREKTETLPHTAVAREESLAALIPFWRNWKIISQYQKDITENLRTALLGDGFQKSLQFAPTNLVQSILPSSFSLFQFTKEMRGNPAVETRIVSEVAGYGSQLGTILDFLEVLEKQYPLKNLADEEDTYKVMKFRELVKKIKKVKDSG